MKGTWLHIAVLQLRLKSAAQTKLMRAIEWKCLVLIDSSRKQIKMAFMNESK